MVKGLPVEIIHLQNLGYEQLAEISTSFRTRRTEQNMRLAQVEVNRDARSFFFSLSVKLILIAPINFL